MTARRLLPLIAISACTLVHCYWLTPYEDLTSGSPDGGRDAPSGADGGEVTFPPGGPWNLVFHDEFDGTTLDTTKWDTKYPRDGDRAYSDFDNHELQWYHARNATVEGGVLRLTARREDHKSEYSGRVFNYTSAMIQSKPSFSFQYGYIQTRVLLPKGSGFHPSLWSWPASEQTRPWFEVIGFFGDNVELAYCGSTPQSGQSTGTTLRRSDWTAEWHVFAVDWAPNRLTWYIDGVEVHSSASLDATSYLLFTLSIPDGERAPAPNGATVFPSALQVDYIRVFQKRQ